MVEFGPGILAEGWPALFTIVRPHGGIVQGKLH